MTRKVVFKLFVAGSSSRSQQAIANLKRICAGITGGPAWTVVDVMRDPQQAEDLRILTTPTLLKVSPGPERRVTGDLSDVPGVLVSLAIDPATYAPLSSS